MKNQFDLALFKACTYWEEKFQPKDNISTVCSSVKEPTITKTDPIEAAIVQSCNQWEQFLFNAPEIEQEKETPQQMCFEQIQPPMSVVDTSSSDLESSKYSQSDHHKKVKKNKKNKCKQLQVKKRFTVSDDQYIITQVQFGFTFEEISSRIPGSTSSSIKHHYFKKLRNIGMETEQQDIYQIVEEVEELLVNNIDKEQKARRLRDSILNLENLFNQTKESLLQEYSQKIQ